MMKNLIYGMILLMAMVGCRHQTMLQERPIGQAVASSGNASGYTSILRSLQQGDLLFVVNPQGNAITEVTEGYDGMQIDHVGVLLNDSNGEAYVVEAVPQKGVVKTHISDFLSQNAPMQGDSHILVGRLSVDWDIPATKKNLLCCIGVPYDSLYLPDNQAVYCSELVQQSFVDRHGQRLFETIPMQFRNKEGDIPQTFVRRYQSLNIAVPEGQPGTNPGQLSRSRLLKMIGMIKNVNKKNLSQDSCYSMK